MADSRILQIIVFYIADSSKTKSSSKANHVSVIFFVKDNCVSFSDELVFYKKSPSLGPPIEPPLFDPWTLAHII